MIEDLFIDTDCISAFLWVEKQSVLSQLYSQRIIIPRQVYNEISNPSTPHLKQRIDNLVQTGDAQIIDMEVGSEEFRTFLKLTQKPEAGHTIIGDGEAAAISLAKERDGILASNNLRDVCQYVAEYSLKHITTGDILVEAYTKGLITEQEGNNIWSAMLNKRRKIGANSFSEYLRKKMCNS